MLMKAIVGGGCFWCTQAVFQPLKGVSKVESGYAGGSIKNPTYSQICTGKTDHAEVIRISYNPKIINYHSNLFDIILYLALIYIFLHIHDPTTLNCQGHDCGTQYRSTIMYETEEERKIADEVIK